VPSAQILVEDIVYGKRKLPHPKTMREIAKVFKLDPKQIREFAIAIEERKNNWSAKLSGRARAVCKFPTYPTSSPLVSLNCL
jgi:hypothetical protein